MPDSPTPYPLDPVTVSGTNLTLDYHLAQPNIITRTIAALAGQRFYADRIYRPGPEVVGGAILFERPNPLLTDLYAGRRTQEMAPGTQFPMNRFTRGVPLAALPRKIGTQMKFTKEEVKRNRFDLLENEMVQAANTLARDIEILALSELNAVIAAESRTTPAAATWASYVALTYNNTTKASQPLNDLVAAQVVFDTEERNHVFNRALFHPVDFAQLIRYYGASGVDEALASVGITEYWRTPRQTQGKVKLWEAGQVGTWSNEFPMAEVRWTDEKTDNTEHYAWSASPLFAVTDQFGIIELTGVS